METHILLATGDTLVYSGGLNNSGIWRESQAIFSLAVTEGATRPETLR